MTMTRHYRNDDPAYIDALRAALITAVTVQPTTDWAFDGEDENAYWDGIDYLDAAGRTVANIHESGCYTYTYDQTN